MESYKILSLLIKYRILIVLGLIIVAALFSVPIIAADGVGGFPGPSSGGG
ncbi:MAG: hypothetical protein ACP6IU_13340 [Candidatus Asgardarchaeia archaeon]